MVGAAGANTTPSRANDAVGDTIDSTDETVLDQQQAVDFTSTLELMETMRKVQQLGIHVSTLEKTIEAMNNLTMKWVNGIKLPQG